MTYSFRKLYSNLRYNLLRAMFILFAFVLLLRLIYLTIINERFLQNQGNARSLRINEIPAYRGIITDRNGKILAVSTPVYSIWINPEQFNLETESSKYLLNKLNINYKQVKQKLSQIKNIEFLYLKRQVAPHLAEEVKLMNIPGIYVKQEFKRYYPEGEVAAHIVGFTNIDDKGQEGIELAYEDWLRGIPGKAKVLKDRLGHVIRDIGIIKSPEPGHNLITSIDLRLQYIAYRELKTAIENLQLKSGTVIILNAKTGEILAMVNYPSFNPNVKVNPKHESIRNRAMTDLFEPGSVIKVFPIALALETNTYKVDDIIDTNPGKMLVEGKVIEDIHNYGQLTVADVLRKSSNIGTAKILFDLNVKDYISLLKEVGLGSTTNSGFPGEMGGYITEKHYMGKHTIATLGFGYSLSVTPIQLARAYSVFLGKGTLLPITLLKQERIPKMKEVLSPALSKTMLELLENVVEHDGSGRRAKLAQYRIAGKTGTARLLGAHGYDKDRHVGSFIGMGPVSDPELIVTVVLNDPPRGQLYYGGEIAAPVFAQIMSESLRILQVKPDKEIG